MKPSGKPAGGQHLSAINGNYGSNYANSVSGLRDANLRIRAVDSNTANANSDGFSPDRIDSQAEKTGGVGGKASQASLSLIRDKSTLSQTDYATESTNLILARRVFSANLKALQAQRQADEAILNTVG
jgi:flagellar hook protein FlgE